MTPLLSRCGHGHHANRADWPCEDRLAMKIEPNDVGEVHRAILRWFNENERDLPWRGSDPWAVMVSEFMLQQTPVVRVLPVFACWMDRWPTPAALAAIPAGEAVRAWGALGYPRRALRLHAAARTIVTEHGGLVPDDTAQLRSLPGVGEYTAAAIASFGYGQAHAVLDTNVRRVFARLVTGEQYPSRSVSVAERRVATSLLPQRGAARWSAAVMELGALVCTSSNPSCSECPVRNQCAWRAAGYRLHTSPKHAAQSYVGTDRQCRGRLLAVLRQSDEPVSQPAFDHVWPAGSQRERAIAGLLADGLIEAVDDHHFVLPGTLR